MFINRIFQSKLLKKLLALLVMGTLLSCNETVAPNTSEFGYEYYPMEVGTYRVYYTSTTRYNLDGSIETNEYLTKEVAEDSIIYADGSIRVVLGRYSADLSATKWQKDSLWAVLKDDAKIVVSEANIDFVKLVFPVKESINWDGNSINSQDNELYKIENLGKTYSYDTLSYTKTLTVIQADLVDPVKITSDDYRIEVFAADIGLVHKLNIKVNYCSSCVENGKIDDGYIFEQKLIEFGKE